MQSWTDLQSIFYCELLARARATSWRELCFACLPGCRLRDPTDELGVLSAEETLGVRFPSELRDFFQTCAALYDKDGANLVMSLPALVEENLRLWSGAYDDVFMPFQAMFIFGGPGNGDRYFYPILRNGTCSEAVYRWDHETDSRAWYAESLASLLITTRTETLA